jgi:hypothetical protein
MSKLSLPCVPVPAVIEAIDRLPTGRSELFVLEFLLRRRIARGRSIERLYASLLSQFVSAHYKLPDLNPYLPPRS